MSVFAIANILQNMRDRQTKAMTVVSEWEHQNHDGDAYYIEGHTALTSTEQLTVKFVTPPGPEEAHFGWTIDATGVSEIYLYEDAEGGMAGGTTMAVLNGNRNSTNASKMKVVSGVTTSTAVGALLHDWAFGLAQKKNLVGGEASRNDEIVLKSGSTMLGLVVSNSTGNVVSFRAGWSEITPAPGPKVSD